MSNQYSKTNVEDNNDLGELIKNSLRKTPPIVVIGEVQGHKLEELMRIMENCNKNGGSNEQT